MDCEHMWGLISAQMDGEISPDERRRLEVHLADCPACRLLLDELLRQNADLQHGFAARRSAAAQVGDRVIEQIRTIPTRARPRRIWLPMLLSAAAGFLLALILFQPWDRSESRLARDSDQLTGPEPGVHQGPPAPGDSVERLVRSEPERHERVRSDRAVPQPDPPRVELVVAKGGIEMLPPGQETWQSMNTGAALDIGTRVRTGSRGLCEFRTPDGSLVRLDSNTELTFHTQRRLELAEGRIFSSVARDEQPYAVNIPRAEATVTALGTQFDVECRSETAVLTVVEGSTRVAGTREQSVVKAKEQAKIVAGAIADRNQVYDLIVATSWVHEILKLKGRDNEELAKRMNDLFAQIGEGKVTHMYEEEILALGDHCVIPLTRFIQSERSKGDRNKNKRVLAAQILAKIAEPWIVADLIELLGDGESKVRFHAATALARLTDPAPDSLSPEQWRDEPAEVRQSELEQWRKWWQQHQDQYPSPP